MDLTRETFSKVDVLIIGAGPAGLMAATWMARCGINARVIDKRGTKIFTGYGLSKSSKIPQTHGLT